MHIYINLYNQLTPIHKITDLLSIKINMIYLIRVMCNSLVKFLTFSQISDMSKAALVTQ